MKILRCLQISFIYIGAIIGAGFATGREIIIYFGDSGVVSGMIAGILMGALCGLFLMAAKSFRRLKNSRKAWARLIFSVIKCILWLCTLVSFICMVSGCEEIIENSYGIDNVGLWTGIFVSVLGVCEMSVMRKFNSIIVPMIMVLLVALASKGDIDFAGEIGVEKILGYCGMNIMMGGYIIAEQEEEFKAKQILFISVVTAVFFAASIMLVYSVSIDYRNFSMPVFEFSKSCDMKSLSGMIIYLAIFSTLIGCSKLICQENAQKGISGIFSAATLIIFTLLSLKFDFSTLVGYCYPIIGYVGVGYTAFMLGLPLIYKASDRFKKESKNQHCATSVNAVNS